MIPSKVVGQRVVVPDHVVYRQFATEMVVLNLESGQYHGLNPTAGRMLEVLADETSIAAAVRVLAAEFGQPVDRIDEDLGALLATLLERNVVSIEDFPSVPR